MLFRSSRVNTKKKGIDGEYWYVVADKNSRRRWMREKSLFVIYSSINPDAKKTTWRYKKFPATWDWVGGGTTVPLQGSVYIKYPNEEQFVGSPMHASRMKTYLTNVFTKLKHNGTIQHFKIVTTIGLRKYMREIAK